MDRLYQDGNVSQQQRLKTLEANHSVVVQREDSFLREIMVLILTGKYARAIDCLTNNSFHAQEGRREIHVVVAVFEVVELAAEREDLFVAVLVSAASAFVVLWGHLRWVTLAHDLAGLLREVDRCADDNHRFNSLGLLRRHVDEGHAAGAGADAAHGADAEFVE